MLLISNVRSCLGTMPVRITGINTPHKITNLITHVNNGQLENQETGNRNGKQEIGVKIYPKPAWAGKTMNSQVSCSQIEPGMTHVNLMLLGVEPEKSGG